MPGWMKWGVALLVGFALIVVGFRWAGWLLSAFFVLNCLVLIIVVLLQSGKAADLAGAFGGAGSQTAFGPRGAATVLSQATTWCAVMFMVCAMALALRSERGTGSGSSVIYDSSKPASKPAAPATTPAAPAATQPATTQSSPAPSQQSPAPASPAQSPKKQ
jgi:preprotein translocase subunit SecG